MQAIKSKIKKTELLIRTRKAQLDEESQKLSNIRSSKLEHLEKLKEHQANYMNGVDSLNIERQSGDRLKLSTLERSVDYSKSRWYQCLRQVKELEEQEKKQLSLVLVAQRNLKSMEKIQEGNRHNLQVEVGKNEQKSLDEMSVHNFNKRHI